MTDDERQMLKRIDERTEENHRFWHEPMIIGGKTRAWEHDQMARHWKLGRFSFKAVVWVGACITGLLMFGQTIAAAWVDYRGGG
jgi:uncharacterized membrane protein YsdA (DUF1294 family)